jgi:hypothetical protein
MALGALPDLCGPPSTPKPSQRARQRAVLNPPRQLCGSQQELSQTDAFRHYQAGLDGNVITTKACGELT